MKNTLKKIIKVFVLLVVILISTFLIYTSIYYKADEVSSALLYHENIHIKNDDIIEIYKDNNYDKAIVFYPGAKVEYISYLPILNNIVENSNVKIFLVKMPFNLAVLDYDAADNIISENKDINVWYVGGHSMGGAMASNYASRNKEKVKGVILLGAYIYGGYDDKNTITIYGELNKSVKDKINYAENIVEIKGGNHSQFGNYGEQKGDEVATISRELQQNLAVDEIIKFIGE